ncbi:DUF6304 family protein [Tenacibaculum agarivorans]|uniref:DUF6304 family protein n=1 Tax=Tenacibaculum agarivorans TaxID=1908389 RepID=UPI00094BAA98|nr:DUF6304 family protein [Tenacibaculum agarivorans]
MKKDLAIYKGVYRDKKGSHQIKIYNDYEFLSFQLGQFKFEGTSIDDFELLDYDKYSSEELERFSFNKIRCGDGFSYEICDYDLTLIIPIQLIEGITSEVKTLDLKIFSKCGKALRSGAIDKYELCLEITINKIKYTGQGDLFEIAANDLIKNLKGKYRFNNCFGCSFSDYSVYGQNTFGTMLCFKNQKKKYLKVKTKAQYMNLNREDRLVQETFLCEEFEIRKNNLGYRG